MSAMTRDKMLRLLNEHGEDAGSDYNDGDEVHGRFGWTVTQNGDEAVLTVTYEDQNEGAGPALSLMWHMVPMGPPLRPVEPAQQPVVVDFPEGGFPQ